MYKSMSRFIYLHGFASSPSSRKARFFEERFRELGIGLEVPDLAEGRFSKPHAHRATENDRAQCAAVSRYP